MSALIIAAIVLAVAFVSTIVLGVAERKVSSGSEVVTNAMAGSAIITMIAGLTVFIFWASEYVITTMG